MRLVSFENGIFYFLSAAVPLYLCFIGGKSSSTSIEDNSNIAAQEGTNVVLDNITLGSGNSFTLENLSGEVVSDALDSVDRGLVTVDRSVQSAFGFGSEALVFGDRAVDRAFKLSTEIARDQASAAKDTLRAAVTNSQDSQNRVIDFARNVVAPAGDQVRTMLYVTAGLGLITVFALRAMSKK